MLRPRLNEVMVVEYRTPDKCELQMNNEELFSVSMFQILNGIYLGK